MRLSASLSMIIDSDNGLSPGRRQAIIWTNAGIWLIWPLGTNFNEILIGIQTFSFKKTQLKMSPAKWRPFCLGLNVLIFIDLLTPEGCFTARGELLKWVSLIMWHILRHKLYKIIWNITHLTYIHLEVIPFFVLLLHSFETYHVSFVS